MAGISAAAVAKATAALLKNEKTRKAIGWLIAFAISPIILLVVLLCTYLQTGTQHNTDVLHLTFYGGDIPSVQQEYADYIEDMRISFAMLDEQVAAINEMSEDGPVDAVRVKAIFFSLFFGLDSPSERDHKAFVECFVVYEDREREVEREKEVAVEPTPDNPDPDPPTEIITVTETEEYTVAVPIVVVNTIYANIYSVLGITATPEQRTNAEEIYRRIAGFGFGEYDYDPNVPFVGIDGFVSPVGDGWRSMVTSEFGWRDDPMNPGRGALHRGIDFAAGMDYPIVAALDGTVIFAGWHYSWGNYVKIDHGGGFTTLYAHNSSLTVSTGQQVTAGQQIAAMGNSGDVSGPTGIHLHFEIAIGGELRNPREYLP